MMHEIKPVRKPKIILPDPKTLAKSTHISYDVYPKILNCMDLNEADVNEIAVRFKERTGKDFNATFKQFFPRLKSFLNNKFKDEEEAKDIASEAFLKSIKDIDGYIKSKANFSTWLFTIAKNMHLQRVEKKNRFSQIDTDLEDNQNEYLVADNPSDNAIRENNTMEKIDLVKEAIKNLPERNAEVITMREFKEMSYQEIADFYQKELAPFFKTLDEARETIGKYIKFDYDNYTFRECIVKGIEGKNIILEWNQERMAKWEEQTTETSMNKIKIPNKRYLRVPYTDMRCIAIVVPLSTIKSQIKQSRQLLAEKLRSRFDEIDSRTMYD